MKTTHFWTLCFLAVLFCVQFQLNLSLDEIADQKLAATHQANTLLSSNNKNKKYAFATIHYEGTQRDDEYLLGIRVLIKSVRMLGHTEDFLVLVTESVKQETRQILTDASAKVIEVPSITNPYKSDASRRRTYQSRFDQTLIKLHVWNQLEYDRIIYMDADNIVLNRADNLWNCGHFCAVFMNVAVFHTGLLVIKPDTHVYNDMLRSLASVESYDGADQGFFVGYFKNMEYSPLWNDSQTTQSQDKQNRMPINYNMNHIYYYEKSNWDFYRRNQFKEWTVPAVTLGFPITPILKPWYWHPYLFLQVHWTWQAYRDQLGDSWNGTFWALFLLFASIVALLEWKSARLDRYFQERLRGGSSSEGGLLDSPSGSPGTSLPLRTLLCPLSVLGSRWSSLLFGLVSVLISIWFSLKVVPAMMPPSYALPLFSFIQIVVTYAVFLRLFHLLYGCPTPSLSTMAGMATVSFIVQVCGYFMMNGDYSNPVSKTWAILISLQAVIGTEVYYFIRSGSRMSRYLGRLNNNHAPVRTIKVEEE